MAYTRDQSASGSLTQKVYVDGQTVRLATDNAIAFVDNTLPKYIGISSCCGTYNGLIDEVRLWNYPRTQDEIQRDMRRELSGTESGLVGYWKFDENDGGCWTRDSTANGNDGQLVSNASTTCALSGASGDRAGFSTDIPALNGDLPKVINIQITNSSHYKSQATSEKGFTIKAFEYSTNGSGWAGIKPTDDQFNEDNEDFEFDFKQEANANPYPGYILETQTTDSGWRQSKNLYFAPFNLKSVTNLNNHLELTVEINKQRDLLKNRLSHFKIEYSSDGANYQKLLDEIPADFEQVRSSMRNLASHDQPNCDPCLFEDSTMYVSYTDNNSLLRVKTKEEFKKPETKFTFKTIAANFDGNRQESGTISLEPDPISTKTAAQTTPATTLGTTDEAQTAKTKSLPGQKTTFETRSGGETGPIAALVNGVISTILGIWEKIRSISL